MGPSAAARRAALADVLAALPALRAPLVAAPPADALAGLLASLTGPSVARPA
jgi:hypothetical protein